MKVTDDKSTLVQALACCHHATSHYLSQCWPRSMSSYGVTRPQWVNVVSYNIPANVIKTAASYQWLRAADGICCEAISRDDTDNAMGRYQSYTKPSIWWSQCWSDILPLLPHAMELYLFGINPLIYILIKLYHLRQRDRGLTYRRQCMAWANAGVHTQGSSTDSILNTLNLQTLHRHYVSTKFPLQPLTYSLGQHVLYENPQNDFQQLMWIQILNRDGWQLLVFFPTSSMKSWLNFYIFYTSNRITK